MHISLATNALHFVLVLKQEILVLLPVAHVGVPSWCCRYCEASSQRGASYHAVRAGYRRQQLMTTLNMVCYTGYLRFQ